MKMGTKLGLAAMVLAVIAVVSLRAEDAAPAQTPDVQNTDSQNMATPQTGNEKSEPHRLSKAEREKRQKRHGERPKGSYRQRHPNKKQNVDGK